MIRRPPRSPPFPYTPLSRSDEPVACHHEVQSAATDRRSQGHHRGDADFLPGYPDPGRKSASPRSEEHTSELQSHLNLVCRLLLEKKKKTRDNHKPTLATTRS